MHDVQLFLFGTMFGLFLAFILDGFVFPATFRLSAAIDRRTRRRMRGR